MNDDHLSFIISRPSLDEGRRLDAFLADKVAGWSRSRLQKLIDDGDVLVNQKAVKSSYKIRGGDEIEVELTVPEIQSFEPENIALDVVFEDEFIAVINKSAGMVVHPGAGNLTGTLANAIAYQFKVQSSKFKAQNNRVGIVHRLDKDTSGLIIAAKTEAAHENLSEQFRNREVFKSYLALVYGEMRTEKGVCEGKIGRDSRSRLKMAVTERGREAKTLWRVRQQFERFTLLDVEIKTGRTHQIRVHLAALNRPVVGDELYNSGRDNTISDARIRTAVAELNRFFLHAERLSFKHPQTGEILQFQVDLPPELQNLLGILSLSK